MTNTDCLCYRYDVLLYDQLYILLYFFGFFLIIENFKIERVFFYV